MLKVLDKIEEIIKIVIFSSLVYLVIPLTLLIIKVPVRYISIFCIIFINTIYSFVSGLKHTKKYGFNWYHSLIVGIMFIPCSIVIYNKISLLYCILYILVTLIGSLIYYKYTKK